MGRERAGRKWICTTARGRDSFVKNMLASVAQQGVAAEAAKQVSHQHRNAARGPAERGRYASASGDSCMKRTLIVPALILLYVGLAQAQQEPKFEISHLTKSGQQAYKKLLSAKLFRLGGVDYAGLTSAEELALRGLLKEKRAVEALKTLVHEASPEGGLYGLLGLRLKEMASFQRAVEQYKLKGEPPERASQFDIIRIPKGQIATQEGCLLINKDRDEVLAEIESGAYDSQLKKKEK
jgi:hypothetical protein